MRLIKQTRWLIAAIIVAACSDATSPGSRPLFGIVAGSGTTDTVAALLPQALVVEVRDNRGGPRSGIVVRFDALPPSDSTRRTEAAILLARLSATTFASFTSDSTDASGRAKALLRFGTVAGQARVLVTVPELGLQDTAHFTVNPGAAAKIAITNRDTAIFVGSTLALNAAVADRFNNRRQGTLEFVAGPSIASVDASGHAVAASTPGRGFIALRAGPAVDTARVSVVPRGTLVVVAQTTTAFSAQYSLATVDLDGSGFHALTTVATGASYPKWGPAGDRIIFQEGDDFSNGHISIVDLNGKRQQLLPAGTGITMDLYGRFSKDGAWVYFSGRRPTDGNFTLFRVHPDGTGLEAIPPAGFNTFDVAWRSNPSPDGTKLAYVFTGTLVRVMDIATRAVTRLDVNGQFPQWSPDGQFITYTDQFAGRLHIMRANGTEQRTITTPTTYGESAGYDFTSDGKWIVVRGSSNIDLVNVADGSTIPLPYSRTYFQPAFKP